MVTVSRRELKYMMNCADSLRLQEEFNLLLQRDEHSERDYYMVRSLYFDSLNNADWFDKLGGEERRKKLRLRIYDLAQDTAKFEIKKKENIYQQKISLSIPRKDAEACIRGEYEALLNYGSDAAGFYALCMLGAYRPAAVIEYRRRAYTFPSFNVRVTFDAEIRSCETGFDLWSPELAFLPVLDSDCIVLEVKYDRYLPEPVKKILAGHPLNNISFSKYGKGRRVMAYYL